MTSTWAIILIAIAALLAMGLCVGVGVLTIRWLRHRQRVRIEDAAKALHRAYRAGRPATLNTLIGPMGISERRAIRLVEQMEQADLVRCEGGFIRLTESGVAMAVRLVRGHRLWERLLADDASVPLGGLHAAAERAEHRLTDRQIEQLAEYLGDPATDPHGDPIPTAEGRFAAQHRSVLTDWPVGEPAEVVHVEDEPPQAMRKIAALGLRPGMVITVTEKDARRLQIETDERRHGRLSPIVAGNVHVHAAPVEPKVSPTMRLSQLAIGEEARVVGLSDACRGLTRRRLLDLGMTPGTTVHAELSDAMASARAYRVRQTLIALRREQAEQVFVERGHETGGGR